MRIPLRDKKLFMLDMDGTIYLGDRLFDSTKPFLEQVLQNGARYAFLTNNSSKSATDYVSKLNKMGIACGREDIFTSVEASAAYIKKYFPGAKVFAAGTKAMVTELSGFRIDARSKPRGDENVVLQGFDTELEYWKVEGACRLIDAGAAFLACNIDRVCPVEDGYIPDCGSICEMISSATGRKPVYIGKPEASMIEGLLGRRYISKELALMVGDRLYTDILCGTNAGVDTVLVLSGETALSDMENSIVKPTYIMQDIGELLQSIRV